MTLLSNAFDVVTNRRRALSVCITAALAIGTARVSIGTVDAHAEILPVTNCDDAGPGSLRDTLANALEGDIVQLNTLSCSIITLTTGELETNLNDITIEGNYQTISANAGSRVIEHTGSGQLTIDFLTVQDGSVGGSNQEAGGCIASQGDVYLLRARVQNCSVYSSDGFTSAAVGGGMYARGHVTLVDSVVADNMLYPGASPGNYTYGKGGGVFAGSGLRLDFSTISGNVIHAPRGYIEGGGFYSGGPLWIAYSTVSGNSAYFSAAGWISDLGVSFIRNSTISGNTAQSRLGGIWSHASLLEIWNSTIAFNTAEQPSYPDAIGGGIGEVGGYVALRNSIVADNTVGNYAQDVSLWDQTFAIVGRNSLVVAANAPLPPDTLRSDPLLAPLADNGGATLTHALLSGSPAIDAGNPYDYDFTYDQRGFGYSRRSGARADIGAFEVQQAGPPDSIFRDGFE